MFAWVINDTKKEEKLELERMDDIVEEIEDALEDKNYKLALMHAKTLKYTLNDEDLKKEWQIKQEYYIDKIYEEAEKNNIILEQPTDETADDETSGTESSKTIGDEIQGFFDELVQDNDDTFSESSE